MKIIHTPKLRAEAKHVARHRQLSAPAALFFLWTALAAAGSPDPPPETPLGELHAAQWMAAGLLARHAGQEELEKMDRVFAGLEAKYPQEAAMKNGHAEFLSQTGQRERAMATWRAAEQLDPKNAVVLDHLGDNALAAGEVKKAARYYARAVESAPDDAAYQFSYANVAFLFRHDLHDAAHPDSESMLQEALTHFAEAVRLEPLNIDYARALAETYYALGKPDWNEALQAWRHLYDISPEKDFALVNVARVQLKLGRKKEARTSLEKVKNGGFDRVKGKLLEQAAEK